MDEAFGMGHQGMMLIRMDESTFATEIVYGDFWHSFYQYIDHNGSDIYLYEQSEGDRCTKLSRFDANSTGTDYFDALVDRFPVLPYGGGDDSAWAQECYATAEGVSVTSDGILGIGTSIDQSLYDKKNDKTSFNIYVTYTPFSNLSTEATTVKWLTNYKNDGSDFMGVALTKITDDRFLVTWEECDWQDERADKTDPLSDHILHYVFIDGKGNKLTKEYKTAAAFSDCYPILSGNKAVFCSSMSGVVDFYSIDVQTGSFSKRVYTIPMIWDAAIGRIADQVYTGKAIEPKPVIKYNKKILKEGVDYTISYKKNTDIGTAKVTINGIGDYDGRWNMTFKIVPKGTSLKKMPAGKKSFTVKWKKQTKQTTGYQIEYSLSKNFKKGAKRITVNKNKTTSKKIKKLKAKKKYFVRIRTYKKVGSKQYYSAWSKVKTVKTK